MYLPFIALALILILIFYKITELTIRRRKCGRLMPDTAPSFLNPFGDVGTLVAKYIMKPETNTLHLTFFTRMDELFLKFKSENLFCVWLGYVPLVMIIKADGAKELLKGMRTNTKSSFYDFLEPFFGEGLLTSDGEKWKARRKLLTPCFHSDILRDFLLVFNENCQKLADIFQGETEKEFTIIDYPVKLSSLDMMCETIFGVKINAQENGDSKYAKACERLGDIFMSRIYNFWMWPDIVFKNLPVYKEFDYHLKILEDFTKSVIKEKKARYLENPEAFEKKKRKALMDMLLERHFKLQDMNEDDIREEVNTFILEGHETIAASIIWALFLIGHHPEVQAKLQEELDEVFGGDRESAVTMDDLNNLNYMECVIKEVNRIYTIVPVYGRQINEDIIICGKTVPKGVTCCVCSYYLHRNESVFPDPEKFDPDRFLPENAAKIPQYGYLPFSAGPRDCIDLEKFDPNQVLLETAAKIPQYGLLPFAAGPRGWRGKVFAMLEMKTLLSYIMRRFTIRSLDSREKVKPVFHVSLNNSIPVRIQFRNRPRED